MQEISIEIKGKTYPLCLNTAAHYNLDVYCRRQQLGSASTLMMNLALKTAGIMEVALLFWALLEGGRKRSNPNDPPFTVEQACALIDDSEGGLKGTMDRVQEAILAAQPKVDPTAKKDDDGTGTGEGKNDQGQN